MSDKHLDQRSPRYRQHHAQISRLIGTMCSDKKLSWMEQWDMISALYHDLGIKLDLRRQQYEKFIKAQQARR